MTTPKKKPEQKTKPKTAPNEADFDDIVGALLKVPQRKKTTKSVKD